MSKGFHSWTHCKGQKSNNYYGGIKRAMKTNSNLEFRKIPSLNFLYEIRRDGRVFRNAKSKKQYRIEKVKGEYKVLLDESVLDVKELLNECWSNKPVRVTCLSPRFTLFAPSLSTCAYALAEKYGKPYSTIRSKLKQRRKKIFDADIYYFRNAET